MVCACHWARHSSRWHSPLAAGELLMFSLLERIPMYVSTIIRLISCPCGLSVWNIDHTPSPSIQVGPGSYTPKDRIIEHGYAPFLSTEIRNLRGGQVTTSAYTPGPGHYTNERPTPVPFDVPAPFSTSGPRLAFDKSTAAATPGPGEYDGSKAARRRQQA